MILTKNQIEKLVKLNSRAMNLSLRARNAADDVAAYVSLITKIEGFVDDLQADGLGFTPISNNDTHVSIEFIINHAKKGEDITEELILDNLSF